MFPRTSHAIPMALTYLTLLAGCSDLSGLGGKAQYACAAPEGVQCNSVSGNYYNSFQPRSSNSSATAVPTKSPQSATPPGAPAMQKTTSATLTTRPSPVFEPAALRSQARVLRLWIKPWEDSEHDLVDQSYVYVQAEPGRWQLAHAQRQIRDAYAPLKPPVSPTAAPAIAPAIHMPSTMPAPTDAAPAAPLANPAPEIPAAGGEGADVLPAPPA